MSKIENLFTHTIPFNFGSEYFGEGAISRTLFCTKDTTKDSISVYSVDDLFNKLKPFISYLQSVTTVTPYRGDQPNKSIYDIFLNVKGEPYLRSVITIIFDKIDPNIKIYKDETRCNKYLRYSFEISVNVVKYYPLRGETSRRFLEQESSSERDDEYDNDDTVEPKPHEESFRIDKCVICLENEPNILFTDCNHMCTCSECEKIKLSVKRSYCRTEISKRIKY